MKPPVRKNTGLIFLIWYGLDKTKQSSEETNIRLFSTKLFLFALNKIRAVILELDCQGHCRGQNEPIILLIGHNRY